MLVAIMKGSMARCVAPKCVTTSKYDDSATCTDVLQIAHLTSVLFSSAVSVTSFQLRLDGFGAPTNG